MIVVCVLRSGGEYTSEHVWALKRGVRNHLTVPYEFRVLSDMDFGPIGIQIRDKTLARWWAKMELFRPETFAPNELVLYFDLDTMIIGNIDDLATYKGAFAMLSDFYKPSWLQSGMMMWRPGLQTVEIWDNFNRDPMGHMGMYRGDGEYLRAHVEADLLQDMFPGRIISYKRDLSWREGRPIPSAARVICFHGHPRPWQTPLWGTI